MWIIYAIAASLIWGLDYSLAERLLQGRVSARLLLTLQMFGGAVLMAVIGLVGGDYRESVTVFRSPRILWLVLPTILAFALGNLLIFMAIKSKDATSASLVEVSYPLAVISFSWLLFRTVHLNVGTAIGGTLVLAGVALIYRFA